MSLVAWAALSCCVLRASFAQSASLANQDLYEIPTPKFRVLKPRGFQFSIPDSPGVQLVAFHGNLNAKMRKMDVGQFSDDIINKTNAKWVYQNKKLKVRPGDVIYYWMFVIKNGKGYTFDDGVYQIAESEVYETTKKIHKVQKRFSSFDRHSSDSFPKHNIFGRRDDYFFHPLGYGYDYGHRHYGHGHHHPFHSHHGHSGYHPHDSFDSFDSNEHDSYHHDCGHKHFGRGHKHWNKGHHDHHWSDEETETTEASSWEQSTEKQMAGDSEPEASTEVSSESAEITSVVPSRRPLPVSIPVYEEPMEDTTTIRMTDLPPIDIRFGQR